MPNLEGACLNQKRLLLEKKNDNRQGPGQAGPGPGAQAHGPRPMGPWAPWSQWGPLGPIGPIGPKGHYMGPYIPYINSYINSLYSLIYPHSTACKKLRDHVIYVKFSTAFALDLH